MKTTIKPKGKITAGRFLATLIVMFALSVFTGCDGGLLVPDGSRGNPDGLEVPITRLTLFEVRVDGAGGESRRPIGLFVSPVGSGDELHLAAERFPPHNTMPGDAVAWRSLTEDVALVDPLSGKVEVVMGTIPTGSVFVEATIRAYVRDNPTVFADMVVRVIPNWPTDSRRLSFSEESGNFRFDGNTPNMSPVNANNSALSGVNALNFLLGRPGVSSINDFGDLHLGDGIFLLLGTGGAAPDGIDRESSVLGLDPLPGAPPRFHSTSFVIDPENPYRFGITPDGSPRALPPANAMHVGHLTTLLNFNDPYREVLALQRHMRTAGDGGRQFMLLGLQAPFEIVVRYRANGAGDRWVDIRFGDTSGVRIEGPISPSNTVDDARTVRFRYEEFLYSYSATGDLEWVLESGRRVLQSVWTEADGPRVALEPFVPVTFIEFIGGMQFYDIEVRPIP